MGGKSKTVHSFRGEAWMARTSMRLSIGWEGGVYGLMKLEGALSFFPRANRRSRVGGARMLPGNISRRQRPLDLRSWWRW